MILLVSMTQPGEDYLKNGSAAWPNKLRFEKISGAPCLIQHYSQVTPQRCRQMGVRAIFISGFGYGWDQLDLGGILGLNEVVKSLEYPVLGVCGGHQLLGHIFSQDLRRQPKLCDEPMRRLRPGEPDWQPEYHPGWFIEYGIQPVQIIKRDPLFRGMKRVIWVRQSHRCEVRKPPPQFELLASSDECRLQAMRHSRAPVYGVQFHPEAYLDAYPDGRTLLANFFRIAYA